ncbi:uncharacterized protein BDR25DRAFT_332701 [Lindgomyces ingoldianus]|uniref:Uncharacterized protein n=1 Tax=Lindgomyces ingoldianus TaxID=673940 RepID=A0ACB6R4E7_9PLEO|nr:uncharacterized protein BDR25DRAFT_332701 [Lindgomyces ingoldianus]KAF2473970.1 hypothetical protein BDR25DRAFT_332701 [Lindgomyces ingoldianus]
MSFGVSIGDFIRVCEVATRVYKNCRDCPGEYKSLASEARNLTNILQDIADKVESNSIPESKTPQLFDAYESCVEVLQELDKILNHYNSLDTRTKRAFDRVKYDPDKTKSLRQKLTANVVMLNGFYNSLIHDNQVLILEALGRLENDYKGGHREESITSVRRIVSGEADGEDEEDEDAAWPQIIRDLEDVGISPQDAIDYRDFIIDWFVRAVNEGRLMEEQVQPSSPLEPVESLATLSADLGNALPIPTNPTARRMPSWETPRFPPAIPRRKPVPNSLSQQSIPLPAISPTSTEPVERMTSLTPSPLKTSYPSTPPTTQGVIIFSEACPMDQSTSQISSGTQSSSSTVNQRPATPPIIHQSPHGHAPAGTSKPSIVSVPVNPPAPLTVHQAQVAPVPRIPSSTTLPIPPPSAMPSYVMPPSTMPSSTMPSFTMPSFTMPPSTMQTSTVSPSTMPPSTTPSSAILPSRQSPPSQPPPVVPPPAQPPPAYNQAESTVDGNLIWTAQRIVAAWNARDFITAEKELENQLAAVERGVTINILGHVVQPDRRVLRHLLGVCASYSGKFIKSKRLFESAFNGIYLSGANIDDGDIAAARWLGDVCLHLNEPHNTALAWSVCLDGLIGRYGIARDITRRVYDELRLLDYRIQGLRMLANSFSRFNTDASDIFMNTHTVEKSKLITSTLERLKQISATSGQIHGLAEGNRMVTNPRSYRPRAEWKIAEGFLVQPLISLNSWPLQWDATFSPVDAINLHRSMTAPMNSFIGNTGFAYDELPSVGLMHSKDLHYITKRNIKWLVQAVETGLKEMGVEYKEESTMLMCRLNQRRDSLVFFEGIAIKFRKLPFKSMWGLKITEVMLATRGTPTQADNFLSIQIQRGTEGFRDIVKAMLEKAENDERMKELQAKFGSGSQDTKLPPPPYIEQQGEKFSYG